MDDLLDPSVALRPHDDAPVAERHAVAHESRPVSDRLAQELRVPARRAEQADHVADAGSRARLEHGRHVRAVAAELRRKSEGEGAAAREDDLAPRQDALRLDERLRPARGDHAGKRPAREGDGTVVGAGRDHDPAGARRSRMSAFLEQHHLEPVDRNGARARQQLGPRPLRAFEQVTTADEVFAELGGGSDPEAGPGCLKICPPNVGRSSTTATERPWSAASAPAASPAGPPPITRTS